jgi:HSP20 family protein
MLPIISRKHQDFEELFDGFFLDFFKPYTIHKRINSFPCDLQETDEQYIITIDVPSLSKDNIEIEYDTSSRMMNIYCNYSSSKEEDNKKFLLKERYSQTSTRSIKLPSAVIPESIVATIENGVLRIHVDKSLDKSDEILKIKVK